MNTHELTFDGPRVVKRYTSWARGEHLREWSMLQRIHQHAPGLAPQPIAAELESVPPVITMSVVPGILLTTPVRFDSLVAYDAAVTWWSGPDPELLRQPPARMVLGHRDPNLSNYLWDGQRVRIVEFEDATVSDPATELAILMEHMAWRDVDCSPLPALVAVDEQRLLAARRLWAMFWLWLLLPRGRADHQAARVLGLM